VLTELFKFLLDVDSLRGTVCEKRIKEVTALGFENKTAYALKSTSLDLCRSRSMYSRAQIAMMMDELSEMIEFWGYNKGNTCFFYGAKATTSSITFQ